MDSINVIYSILSVVAKLMNVLILGLVLYLIYNAIRNSKKFIKESNDFIEESKNLKSCNVHTREENKILVDYIKKLITCNTQLRNDNETIIKKIGMED
ncbi:hypothetical protein [Metaclostridioides mangenotii]|uniref:hypothetical protein n=1 Tax=Metaclostridioides mangenotii TaxID=1540 RepID=UPI0026EA2DCE|nr:hypothetical protein [Clostridioides mangenotii]